MDITSGKPNPPFLIIAPSGAPMKKSKMQEAASVNLRCHSTRYLFLSSR